MKSNEMKLFQWQWNEMKWFQLQFNGIHLMVIKLNELKWEFNDGWVDWTVEALLTSAFLFCFSINFFIVPVGASGSSFTSGAVTSHTGSRALTTIQFKLINQLAMNALQWFHSLPVPIHKPEVPLRTDQTSAVARPELSDTWHFYANFRPTFQLQSAPLDGECGTNRFDGFGLTKATLPLLSINQSTIQWMNLFDLTSFHFISSNYSFIIILSITLT